MASFFGRRKKLVISEPDPEYQVIYLGNILTSMAKSDFDKPLSLIWRTYCARTRPDLPMQLTITKTGLKAWTKQQGLTEYWAHRITTCLAPSQYPKVFCWIYKHEGKKMKPELRCHAALCKRADQPTRIVTSLQARLSQALIDYKRDKVAKQNLRLSASTIIGYQPNVPKRRILLNISGQNFRPPIARSKSAPRLHSINEEENEQSDESELINDAQVLLSPFITDHFSTSPSLLPHMHGLDTSNTGRQTHPSNLSHVVDNVIDTSNGRIISDRNHNHAHASNFNRLYDMQEDVLGGGCYWIDDVIVDSEHCKDLGVASSSITPPLSTQSSTSGCSSSSSGYGSSSSTNVLELVSSPKCYSIKSDDCEAGGTECNCETNIDVMGLISTEVSRNTHFIDNVGCGFLSSGCSKKSHFFTFLANTPDMNSKTTDLASVSGHGSFQSSKIRQMVQDDDDSASDESGYHEDSNGDCRVNKPRIEISTKNSTPFLLQNKTISVVTNDNFEDVEKFVVSL